METMAAQLCRNSSQEKTAQIIPTINMPKEPQYLTRNWYFSRKEIEDHSPSRMDGINQEEELRLRKLFCSILQEIGIELKVPQVTIATAIMLCHRFFMRQSLAKNDWQTIASASMFLACKAEETPRSLSDVTVVAFKLMYRWDPSAPERIRQRAVYERQKELILTGERLLLYTIAFDLNIEHPYKPLVAALKRLEISQKELAKVAWNFVNDWLHTTLCLEYKSHYVAAGSMYLAAKFLKVKLPTEQGKVWWMQFDVSPKLLEEVIQQMLRMLEKNRKQALPSMHGKIIESKPAAVKALSNVPESGIVSHSDAAQTTGHGDVVDAEALNKSVIPNSPQSTIVNGSSVTQCMALGTTAVDAGRRMKSSVSDSPQSCIISGPSVANCIGHGDMVNTGGQVKSVSKCIENEASSDFHVDVRESSFYQTSDCGSATSAVEDGSCEPRAGESNQSSSSKVVHVQGGDHHLDVNRIREALKKRRRDRKVTKKLVETMEDEIDSEAWIEKELEDGIELETASLYKRNRI